MVGYLLSVMSSKYMNYVSRVIQNPFIYRSITKTEIAHNIYSQTSCEVKG